MPILLNMNIDRKKIAVLLILIAAVVVVCAVSAHDVSAAKTSKTTVKIYNFKPGVSWVPRATVFKNGDAMAGYVEYKGNMMFERGTGVTTWFVGNGLNGDMMAHHTKMVKAKFFFKNKKGKIKSKTVKGDSGHIRTNLIKGYTPYKATVWYKSY